MVFVTLLWAQFPLIHQIQYHPGAVCTSEALLHARDVTRVHLPRSDGDRCSGLPGWSSSTSSGKNVEYTLNLRVSPVTLALPNTSMQRLLESSVRQHKDQGYSGAAAFPVLIVKD